MGEVFERGGIAGAAVDDDGGRIADDHAVAGAGHRAAVGAECHRGRAAAGGQGGARRCRCRPGRRSCVTVAASTARLTPSRVMVSCVEPATKVKVSLPLVPVTVKACAGLAQCRVGLEW